MHSVHIPRSYCGCVSNFSQLMSVWVGFGGEEWSPALEYDAIGSVLWRFCSWRNNSGSVCHKIVACHDSLLFKSVLQPKLRCQVQFFFLFFFCNELWCKKFYHYIWAIIVWFYMTIESPLYHFSTTVLCTSFSISIFLLYPQESLTQ